MFFFAYLMMQTAERMFSIMSSYWIFCFCYSLTDAFSLFENHFNTYILLSVTPRAPKESEETIAEALQKLIGDALHINTSQHFSGVCLFNMAFYDIDCFFCQNYEHFSQKLLVEKLFFTVICGINFKNIL